MFLILGVNVKRLKGSEKTKSRKDMCPYLYSFYHELFVCVYYICMFQITPRTLSSKAESAAFAPSPIEIMICLYGTVETSPAA